jgi:hypothetical protein
LGCLGRGVRLAVVAGLGVVDGLEDVALYLGGGVFDLFRSGPGGRGVHGVVTSWGGQGAPRRMALVASLDCRVNQRGDKQPGSQPDHDARCRARESYSTLAFDYAN